MARVVVGVDGTERSKRALVRARDEAKLRGASLEAIYIYEPPHRGLADELGDLPQGMDRGYRASRGESDEDYSKRHRQARSDALEILEGYVRDAIGMEGDPKPRLVALEGDEVAETLTRHAEGADLLVIGLRRRTPVGKLVLGSDARDIILQAKAPILAVHDDLPVG